MDQTALILTQGLTTATLQCTVKPLFFFFFIKTQPFNKNQNKIISNNHNKQSEKTIQNLSIKNTPKTNHNKQTRKTISSIKRKINHKNKLKQTVKTNTKNYLTNRKINHTNNHD